MSDGKAVKVEIEVYPDIAKGLRDELADIYARMRAGETPEQLATSTALACGMAMALAEDVCRALPEVCDA